MEDFPPALGRTFPGWTSVTELPESSVAVIGQQSTRTVRWGAPDGTV
ncbi:MAG: hypothetical protein ACRC8N_16365 [Aeromonas veronii]